MHAHRRSTPAPTAAERERAAATLAAVARIESLRGGFVVFEAEGLAGGRWYEPDNWEVGAHERVAVPVPLHGDEVAGSLERRARESIDAAVEARQVELARIVSEEAGGDADYFAGLMYADERIEK